MKNKRGLSLLFVYIFILTLVPFNFISNKVKAADLTKYSTSNGLYTKLAVQFKDKSILMAMDKEYEKGTPKPQLRLTQTNNGKETIVKADEDLLWSFVYMGSYGEKLYFFSGTEKKVYAYDLNTLELKPSNSVPEININVKDPENYYKHIDDGVLSINGTQWFTGEYFNMSGEINEGDEGSIPQSKHGFIVNNKGFMKDILRDTYDYMYMVKQNKSDNLAYMTVKQSQKVALNLIDKNNNVKEYKLTNPEFEPESVVIDSNSNIYTTRYKWNYTYSNGYQRKPEFIFQQYKIMDGSLSLVKEIKLDDDVMLSLDNNENLWVIGRGKISKLEDGKLVDKFATNENLNDISIYDENHFAIYGALGYVIVSNNDKADGGNNTNQGQGTNNNSNQSAGSENVVVNANTSQNGSTAVVNVKSSEIAKDKVNQIEAKVDSSVKTVEVKLDAATIKDGKGSAEIKLNNMVITLPFSVVDFDGAGSGAYVSIKHTISTDDSILNGIKSIKKVFQFDMATYDSAGNKIRDIHQFKTGKVKVSFKLSEEDIKGLDTNKLAAFYYNESTKSWENVGGSFDKSTMTFTFETSHFSKFTISEVNTATSLPKTGAFVDMNLLIAVGFLVIVVGSVLTFKKRPGFNK